MLTKAVDSAFLAVHITIALLRVAFAEVRRRLFGSLVPTPAELMDPAVMSRLIGQPVVKVTSTKPNGVIGDDATGTMRAWLDLTLADGSVVPVFTKIAAKSLLLRSILMLTGLYDSELRFYKDVAPGLPAEVKIPKIYAAIEDGCRFILVLENLSATGCTLKNLFGTTDEAQTEAMLRMLAVWHSHFAAAPYAHWSESMRPPFVPLLLTTSMDNMRTEFPGLIPADIERVYRKYVDHWQVVRKYWSTGPVTFVHGDTHIGNVYFDKDGRCGLYDFQVVSVESPMRDVTYFLQLSCDPDYLATHERRLVDLYVDAYSRELDKKGHRNQPRLSKETAWQQYRTHTLYSLTALIISGGAGDFVQNKQSVFELSRRIVGAAQRVDVGDALEAVIRDTH